MRKLLNAKVVRENDTSYKMEVETQEGYQKVWFFKDTVSLERDMGGEPMGDIYVEQRAIDYQEEKLDVNILLNEGDYPDGH